MKFGVIVFPGTNCDGDTYHVIDQVFHQPVEFIWHQDTDLSSFDCIILPGGFAHGDYLRAGAIARFSPVMRAVEEFARSDRPVLGICNGFQVLLEAGLLPGAMLRNDHLQFRCSWVNLRVESTDSPFTSACREGQVLRIPIAHQEGCYYASEDLLAQLERRNQILVRYCDEAGRVTRDANPNGSVGNVAGVCNEGRNVFGLMPHPERCCEAVLGGTDGAYIFGSLLGLRTEDCGLGAPVGGQSSAISHQSPTTGAWMPDQVRHDGSAAPSTQHPARDSVLSPQSSVLENR